MTAPKAKVISRNTPTAAPRIPKDVVVKCNTKPLVDAVSGNVTFHCVRNIYCIFYSNCH